MAKCSKDNGSWDAGHTWYYSAGRWSGEPYRVCDGCQRLEAYYCDDLEFEQLMQGGAA
jgi:hypothetical protein